MRAALNGDGRLGVVVPTGIATDSFNQYFFADCVTTRSLVSLLSFENEAFVFAGIHHAFKFCLLTLTGALAPSTAASFMFFARSTAELTDSERRFILTPDDLALINPNTLTAPIFRTRRDAELTKKIYRRVPVLVRNADPDVNPWGVDFQLMFMMNTDSHLFHTAAELQTEGAHLWANIWQRGDERWLPLYEGKMVHHFNHRWGDYSMQAVGSGDSQLPDVPDVRLDDPKYATQPRYWVAEFEVRAKLRNNDASWLIGFRDITNATNERTMIATVLPISAVGNKLPLLNPSVPRRTGALLPAVLSSFALDYTARQKLGGTSMNFFIAKQLPVLPPGELEQPALWSGSELISSWLAPRVLELTYTAWDLKGFAEDLGYDGRPFHWYPRRRRLLRAELDAAFFHLYGYVRDDVEYAMDTFPIVRRNDEKEHGEYLTKRLILERYDALTKAADSAEPYQTALDPPPADPSVAQAATTKA
jgi:hypothetical protein